MNGFTNGTNEEKTFGIQKSKLCELIALIVTALRSLMCFRSVVGAIGVSLVSDVFHRLVKR